MLLFVVSSMLDEGFLTVHLVDAGGRVPFNVIVDLRVAFIVTFIQILDTWNPKRVVQSATRRFIARVSAQT